VLEQKRRRKRSISVWVIFLLLVLYLSLSFGKLPLDVFWTSFHSVNMTPPKNGIEN
jgi:hypothetical protein